VLAAIFGAVFALQWAGKHTLRKGVSMFGNTSAAAPVIGPVNQLLAN